MTVQELNTLHTICELERNQLLTILAMSLQNPQLAGFLLTGNRSPFPYVEGSTAWLYDCPHFSPPLAYSFNSSNTPDYSDTHISQRNPNKTLRIGIHDQLFNLTPLFTPSWFADAFITLFGYPCLFGSVTTFV